MTCETDLYLEATELRLGLPGRNELEKQSSPRARGTKRASNEMDSISSSSDAQNGSQDTTLTPPPPPKAQIVGWPPVRSYRKNCLQAKNCSENGDASGMYVKVSMDGAPYLRKIDLNVYKSYPNLLEALENMFKCSIEREGYDGSEYAPTYEDKDGDWMLLGDVPWEMFITSCKRLRIMRGSEAKGLASLSIDN